MQPEQFYYAREVLGLDFVIPPASVRCYRLHNQVSHPAFLFFCSYLNVEGKTVIRNINKALGTAVSMTVEVTNIKSLHKGKLLSNLICRFAPTNGVVIFGHDLADSLIEHGLLKDKTLISYKINNKLRACILNPLEELIGSSALVMQKKTKAWQALQTTFACYKN